MNVVSFEGLSARGVVMNSGGRSNVNRILGNQVARCQGHLPGGGDMAVRLDLAEDLPEVGLAADRLESLFQMLLAHSFEAVGNGGSIVVSTIPWRSEQAVSHIEVSIEDNGPGLPEGAFWDLYPTASDAPDRMPPDSQLVLAGRLVQDLGGLITCRSTGQGTRFLVLLPLRAATV